MVWYVMVCQGRIKAGVGSMYVTYIQEIVEGMNEVDRYLGPFSDLIRRRERFTIAQKLCM